MPVSAIWMVRHSRDRLREARASTRHHPGRPHRPRHGRRQLAALHAGGAQHPRRQGGHRPEGPEVLRHPLHQVAGDHGVLHRQGAHRVGGDGAVAQAHHQHALPGPELQQGGELRPHRPGRPAEGVRLPALQAGELHRHVGPLRLAQGLRPLPVQDVHPGDGKASRSVSLVSTPLQRAPPGALLPDALGLHGQVRPPSKHPLFTLSSKIMGPAALYIWYFSSM